MEDERLKNPVFRAMDVFGNVFALNVLFVIFSIPIVTIGASVTALYSMSLKMVRKEEGTIVRGFIQAFKENFKQSTIAEIIVVIAIGLLYGQYLYIINFPGTIATCYAVLLALELIAVAFTLPFLFPLIAAFDNTVLNTFKNAFLLSFSNLWSWAKIVVAWFVPIFISVYYPVVFLNTWYLWLLVIFGLMAYGTSHTINKVFKKIADTQEFKAEQKAEKEKEEKERAEKEAVAREKALAKIGTTSFDEDDLEKEE